MPRFVRALALLIGLTGIAVPSVQAGLPPGGDYTVPAHIMLVGSSAGVPARGAGRFEVVVRDLANNPIPGAQVAVDLTLCTDLHLCADQADPAVSIQCASKRVNKLTDQTGRATFVLLGGSNGAGNALALQGGGRVYVNGTLAGAPTVGAFDLDGSAGVGANDMSVWITDFGSGHPWGRSDFDGDGSLGANDLSSWLTAFASGEQVESCSATCP